MKDKIALVTGASRGIGRAIAESLAAQGAVVVGTATSEKGADAISDYLKAGGFHGRGMVLNVQSVAQIQTVVEDVTKDFGALQILVNNAGIAKDNLLMRMKEDEWDSVIQTNLSSIFHLSKACMRGMMKARFGRIVNISSVVASMGNAGQVNYAAAKAGMEGLTRSMAIELGSRNITVNCVAPGFIDTDMTKALPEAQREALQKSIALGRLGKPEEIAEAVRFLVSEFGGYVTGQVLHVNGGLYM